MIYLDTSVVLAQLLGETAVPPASLWTQPLVSSRLLEYEVWGRLHARGLAASHGGAARDILGGIALLELAPPVLARALDPFPSSVRTLDALHLASAQFLAAQGRPVELATYDERMRRAGVAMGLPVYAV